MKKTIIDYDAIDNAVVKHTPFPFFGVDCVFHSTAHESLLKDFPKIDQGGSFPLESLEIEGRFADLIDEIQSERFRDIFAKKFAVDLKGKPLVITARGYSRQKDGRNHTDSTTKLITILLYVNDDWPHENGRLRMLNSDNINDIAEEFSCGIGQLTAFKVTDNCWHGYEPFEGQRQSIQINYLVEEKYTRHHLYRHKLSAFFKKLFK